MAAVADVRARGRAGARHLQRLPDPARGGPAAGRAAPQPRPEVPLRARRACASSRPTRRSRARAHAGPGAAAADRARRRQLLRRARRRSTALEATGRVIFRYCDATGESPTPPTRTARCNNIAGICNDARNVVGLMPHPERACESALGSADGLVLFESVVDFARERAEHASRRRHR